MLNRAMGEDRCDLINALESELSFLERGGYWATQSPSWRYPLMRAKIRELSLTVPAGRCQDENMMKERSTVTGITEPRHSAKAPLRAMEVR